LTLKQTPEPLLDTFQIEDSPVTTHFLISSRKTINVGNEENILDKLITFEPKVKDKKKKDKREKEQAIVINQLGKHLQEKDMEIVHNDDEGEEEISIEQVKHHVRIQKEKKTIELEKVGFIN